MSKKLVRTQILLDPMIVNKVKLKLKKLPKKISLAEYIRNLMRENIENEEDSKTKKYKLLLSKAGFLNVKTNGNEAADHNDIYNI
jgi:hypothetical protein